VSIIEKGIVSDSETLQHKQNQKEKRFRPILTLLLT